MTELTVQASSALHRKGVMLAAMAGLIWSSGAAIARGLTTDSWTTIFWRGIFACAFLSIFVAFRNRGRFISVFKGMGWPGVAMALSFATASSSFVIALDHTSVAHVLFLVGVSPFIAAIVGWLFLREPVRRGTWIAIGAVCAGIAIMESDTWGTGGLVGDLFGLLMASGFAVGTVIMRRYRQVRMTPAAALAACFGMLFALVQGASLEVGGSDLALLALFGAGQLGVGLAFFTAGARLIPAAEAALCSLIELALGPLWVWLIYREALDPLAMIGGGLIIGAVVCNTVFDRSAAPSAPPIT